MQCISSVYITTLLYSKYLLAYCDTVHPSCVTKLTTVDVCALFGCTDSNLVVLAQTGLYLPLTIIIFKPRPHVLYQSILNPTWVYLASGVVHCSVLPWESSRVFPVVCSRDPLYFTYIHTEGRVPLLEEYLCTHDYISVNHTLCALFVACKHVAEQWIKYADDMVLLAEEEKMLRKELKILGEWYVKWAMKATVEKCGRVHFRKGGPKGEETWRES